MVLMKNQKVIKEKSFLFTLACIFIQRHVFKMALTRKTLQKDEKAYWLKHGFDEKLRKQLNWPEIASYEAFQAKQRKMPIAQKALRKKILKKALQKVAKGKKGVKKAPKHKKFRYRPGDSGSS